MDCHVGGINCQSKCSSFTIIIQQSNGVGEHWHCINGEKWKVSWLILVQHMESPIAWCHSNKYFRCHFIFLLLDWNAYLTHLSEEVGIIPPICLTPASSQLRHLIQALIPSKSWEWHYSRLSLSIFVSYYFLIAVMRMVGAWLAECLGWFLAALYDGLLHCKMAWRFCFTNCFMGELVVTPTTDTPRKRSTSSSSSYADADYHLASLSITPAICTSSHLHIITQRFTQ